MAIEKASRKPSSSTGLGYSRRDFMRIATISAGGSGLAVALAACGSSSSTARGSVSSLTGSALVAAAKKEGSVGLYSTAAAPATQGIVNGFQKAYGIKVSAYRGNSVAVAQRVASEISAGQLGADVLIMDTPVMPSLVQYLAAYDPPTRQQIPSRYKQPTFTQIRVYVGALGWNTKSVTSDPPSSWADLINPRWHGSIGLPDPSATSVASEWFDMVKSLYGEGYLNKLAANKPIVFQTGISVAQAIAAGQVEVGYVYDYSKWELQAQGAPFDAMIPQETFATGSDVGVFQDAAHPDAGRLFCEYACSPAGQLALNKAGNSIATQPSVHVPDAFTLSDLHTIYPTNFTKLAAEETQIIAQFDALFKSGG